MLFKLTEMVCTTFISPLLKTIYLGYTLFYMVLISNFRFSLKFAVR